MPIIAWPFDLCHTDGGFLKTNVAALKTHQRTKSAAIMIFRSNLVFEDVWQLCLLSALGNSCLTHPLVFRRRKNLPNLSVVLGAGGMKNILPKVEKSEFASIRPFIPVLREEVVGGW